VDPQFVLAAAVKEYLAWLKAQQARLEQPTGEKWLLDVSPDYLRGEINAYSNAIAALRRRVFRLEDIDYSGGDRP
jgi:predicted NAD/FAD-dependent oxidoreductase